MAKQKKKTKKPTGLSIVRNGTKFTFKWKKGESYERQQIRYSFGHGWSGWTSVSGTSKTITMPTAYPDNGTKHLKIYFQVKGCRKDTSKINYTWSDAAEKSVPIIIPPKSTWSVTLDDAHENRSTYSWSTSVSGENWSPYKNSRIQTALVKNCNVSVKDAPKNLKASWTDEKDSKGKIVPVGSSGSRTKAEDNIVLADGNSWTRWYRIQSRGAAGFNDWAYAKHVYALPKAAVISRVTLSDTAQGYECYVAWTADSSEAYPIDTTTVQYCMEVPDENLQCPAGVSWTDAVTQTDTSWGDAARFKIDNRLEQDKVLFVRVNTTHDTKTTYGAAKIVNANDPVKIGQLKAPTITELETDSSTYRATITVEHKTGYEGSDMTTKVFMRRTGYPDMVVGEIPNGEMTAIVQCPAWGSEVAFGVQETIADKMTSEIVWRGGAVPTAPTNVIAYPVKPGTVRVEWTWTWDAADSAEISWADHDDAWESTDEPSKYEITKMRASAWNVVDLETGQTWYFRVRLVKGTGENKVYGPWSEIIPLDLTSAPVIPSLAIADPVITLEGETTASWVYVTTDGTAQAVAEVAEVVDGTYNIIATTQAAQYVTIKGSDLGYGPHLLAVRVMSASGKLSDDWSTPVPLNVAQPLAATIHVPTGALNWEYMEVQDDEGESHWAYVLKRLPINVEIRGGESQTLIVERAEDYEIMQPDERHRPGYKGETVTILEGSDITLNNIHLDDGCKYKLIGVVRDSIGQTATAEIEFEVHWTYQGQMPTGSVTYDGVAKITVDRAGTGYVADSIDIYRLSTDRPELIYEGADFGQTYVDPYPSINGGYRLVYKTLYGDWMTDDGPTWLDLDNGFDADYTIIDFDDDFVQLPYNLELNAGWDKDFTETRYLGGSVRGSWGASVARKGSIGTVCTTDDVETIEAMRRLATHPGMCHVRTPDGSSYHADIQVSEKQGYSTAGKIATFDLTVTRVDPVELDGVPLAEWEANA